MTQKMKQRAKHSSAKGQTTMRLMVRPYQEQGGHSRFHPMSNPTPGARWTQKWMKRANTAPDEIEQLLPSGTATDGMAVQLSIATHPNTVKICFAT